MAAIERGRGSMKARARKNTARPSSEPPITSVGKCRPRSTRSTQTSSHHATTTAMPRRRRLVRRTNRTSSMTRSAAKAAVDDAWPDGKLKLACRPRVSCQSGRSRPSQRLSPVVAIAVTDITTTTSRAAQRCRRRRRTPGQRDGEDGHPDRAERDLDEPQDVDQHGVVVGPVLQLPALGVEGVERRPVAGHEEAEHREEGSRDGCPAEGTVAGGGSHPGSMPTPEPAPHARTDSLVV